MHQSSSRSTFSNAGTSKSEKAKIGIIYLVIATLTGLLFLFISILSHLSPTLSGLGIVAYVLGLRHGVDADHIVAIDNTTRKLIQQGKPRLTVGTWFSLGHSTVVIGMIVAIIFMTRTVVGHISSLQNWGSIVGTLISAIFLIIIGFINLMIVLDVYRLFKEARQGNVREEDLETYMAKRGFFNRIFRSLFKFVNEAWQMYPIGVLFGLGFDTASEVALIGISVGIGVSSSIPIWQIFVLPLLFTCGMLLIDTVDGMTMRFLYGWAFLTPVKKIFYNLTVTVMSVLVAFIVGGIELIQVLSSEFKASGAFWGWLSNLDFEMMGFLIIGVFVITWGAAYYIWKFKKYGQNPAILSHPSDTP